MASKTQVVIVIGSSNAVGATAPSCTRNRITDTDIFTRSFECSVGLVTCPQTLKAELT